MKNIIIAVLVTALLTSVGTATATSYINGRQIKPHTIAVNRLTPSAVKTLSANAGVQSPRALAAAVSSTFDYEEASQDITHLPTTVTAFCPAGDVAIAGGYTTTPNFIQTHLSTDGETADNTGWAMTVSTGTAIENDGNPATFTVHVSCVPSS